MYDHDTKGATLANTSNTELLDFSTKFPSQIPPKQAPSLATCGILAGRRRLTWPCRGMRSDKRQNDAGAIGFAECLECLGRLGNCREIDLVLFRLGGKPG